MSNNEQLSKIWPESYFSLVSKTFLKRKKFNIINREWRNNSADVVSKSYVLCQMSLMKLACKPVSKATIFL